MKALTYQRDDPFHMTAHRQIELFKIAAEMEKACLPEEFIAAAIRTALEFEGVADLVTLWAQESDSTERDEIVADIQDLINDCTQQGKEEFTYVKFNDLDAIAKNIREFKDSLLLIVNEHGGVKKLAELTNIPQPSLSRFFNSPSMPHRSTLLRIAKAINLDAIKIETQWTR